MKFIELTHICDDDTCVANNQKLLISLDHVISIRPVPISNRTQMIIANGVVQSFETFLEPYKHVKWLIEQLEALKQEPCECGYALCDYKEQANAQNV